MAEDVLVRPLEDFWSRWEAEMSGGRQEELVNQLLEELALEGLIEE